MSFLDKLFGKTAKDPEKAKEEFEQRVRELI